MKSAGEEVHDQFNAMEMLGSIIGDTPAEMPAPTEQK